MLLISKELQKSLRSGDANINELAEYLMRNNSIYELAFSLAELMQTTESYKPTKIVVSQEEMDTILSIFKVRGVKDDGTTETRGRKPRQE